MKIGPTTVRVDVVPDKPVSGMWHCGPNPSWVTVTHLPTMQSVRVYDMGRGQWKARERARVLLELILDDWEGAEPSFPERVDTTNTEKET